MSKGQLIFSRPRSLPHRNTEVPYVLDADDAFAMKPNLMKPFNGRWLTATQRVFNYRLSRARRIIEKVFGIIQSASECSENEFIWMLQKRKQSL